MKKLTMICMSALLLIAVSCKKDKKTEVENAGSGFRASVEQQSGDSKTQLEGSFVKWKDKDAILVKNSSGTTKRFVTNDPKNDPQNYGYDLFLNDEPLPDGFYTSSSYTAYYPGFETNPAGVYFSGDQLTLPATQAYVAGSFDNGANPMAATSKDDKLGFKNICGVLKLQLYNNSGISCKVANITITSNKEGEMLHGKGTVGFDAKDNPTLGPLNNGGSTLTLNCNGATMNTDKNDPSIYFFVVPVGTLGTSFTVKVTDIDGDFWSKTANAAPQNLIVRSQITQMPELAVTTKHVFSVDDHGTTVKFAPGNLYYDGSSWNFESNQYDFRTYAGKNSCIGGTVTDNGTPSGHWGLFGWSGDTGSAPWGMSTSDNASDYGGNFKDWGEAPGLPSAGVGKSWRTLTFSEWVYLLDTRTTETTGLPEASSRYAKVTVNGVSGMLLFPDSFAWDAAKMGTAPTSTNTSGAAFTSGSYTAAQFTEQEESGIVFLPSAGYREGTLVDVGSNGNYWSSLYYDSYYAYSLGFYSGDVNPDDNSRREFGFSVRLVSEN